MGVPQNRWFGMGKFRLKFSWFGGTSILWIHNSLRRIYEDVESLYCYGDYNAQGYGVLELWRTWILSSRSWDEPKIKSRKQIGLQNQPCPDLSRVKTDIDVESQWISVGKAICKWWVFHIFVSELEDSPRDFYGFIANVMCFVFGKSCEIAWDDMW